VTEKNKEYNYDQSQGEKVSRRLDDTAERGESRDISLSGLISRSSRSDIR